MRRITNKDNIEYNKNKKVRKNSTCMSMSNPAQLNQNCNTTLSNITNKDLQVVQILVNNN